MRTREENRIYMRNWRKGNPPRPKQHKAKRDTKAYQRQWRLEHPERVRGYDRRYRAAHPCRYKSGVAFRLTVANIMNGVFAL